jgi:hypothetical protein
VDGREVRVNLTALEMRLTKATYNNVCLAFHYFEKLNPRKTVIFDWPVPKVSV